MSKKAIMTEALVRILIAALLIWGALKIGAKIGEAYYGGSVEKKEFNNLIRVLNDMEIGDSPLVYDIVLDSKNALFGVGGSGKFGCYLCDESSYIAAGSSHYVIEKEEYCSDGVSCVCLCRNAEFEETSEAVKQEISAPQGLKEYEFPVAKIKCKKAVCEPLQFDIADVSLNPVFKNFYLKTGRTEKAELVEKENHKWENGFLYINEGVSGRYMLQSSKKRQQVYLEKVNKNGAMAIAVCPYIGCLSKAP